MAQVIWTPKALDDLESLLDYISKDAPAAARRFAQKLIGRVELLASHPFLGSYIAEDPTHIYRESGKATTVFSIASMSMLFLLWRCITQRAFWTRKICHSPPEVGIVTCRENVCT